MSKTKNRESTAIITAASQEQLATLTGAFPKSEERPRMSLPRLGMLPKDVTEESGTGKNKTITVLQAAGTFFTEKKSDELNEFGEPVWKKEYIETESIDVVVFYHRKQLRMFDENTETYISSPIYDNSDEVVPLFQNGTEIARGTPRELQAKYPALTSKGKPSSKLKENKILYVLYGGELYQTNLSESSKYAFQNYARRANIPTVVTEVGSEEQTRGSNVYRQMTFKVKRPINSEEAAVIIKAVADMKSFLEAVKEQFTPKIEASIE